MSAGKLVITSSNVFHISELNSSSFYSKEFWHKFILENGGLYDKEIVLQAVLDSIQPLDLVPVNYTVCEKNSHFLARNCGAALDKFCKNLEDVLNSVPIEELKVNMQFLLKKAIEKRHDSRRTCYIDLSAFHKEPELYEVLFCPLSTPRFLLYVLTIVKSILNITEINLSNNDIENLKSLEVLKEFGNFRKLDLSNNRINERKHIEWLDNTVPVLEEISLDGNPICSDFESSFEYVEWIRKIFPKISKIDGVKIRKEFPHQQAWFCSNICWKVVDEFLRHYFTLYDENRKALIDMYSKSAIFSMTSVHFPGETFKQASLQTYKRLSRNLFRIKKKKLEKRNRAVKNADIKSLLCQLPLTVHDPYSFKVDLTFCDERGFILFVSGVFKDMPLCRLRSFNRTFALKKIGQEEYKITNDMYVVRNATKDEINNSFQFQKNDNIKAKRYLNERQEDNMVEVVCRLTNMNKLYSRKCLEECNWDVRNALEAFLSNNKSLKIPVEAFLNLPLNKP